MIKILGKIIFILLFVSGLMLALVEVYPEQMKQAESKLGIEIVEPIREFVSDIKEKIHNSTTLNQQRTIDEIVDDEVGR